MRISDEEYAGFLGETIGAYDAAAESYAKRTSEYEPFPGLLDSLISFGDRCGDGSLILDAGCGGGRDAMCLASRGHPVLGVDLSAGLLNTLTGKLRTADLAVSLTLADIREIPTRESRFSGIWCSAVLLHLRHEDVITALWEFRRVAIPGGLLAASVPKVEEGWKTGGLLEGRRWQSAMSPAELAKTMVAAGVTEVEVQERGRPGWAVCSGLLGR